MASDPPDTDQAVRRVPHRRVRNAFPTAPSDDAVGLGLFGRPSRDGDPTASQTRPPPATPALVSLDGHGTGPPPGGWGIYDAAPPGGILAGSVASHADLARMLPHYASGVILPATPTDPFSSPAGVAATPSPSPTLTPAPAWDIARSETRAWAFMSHKTTLGRAQRRRSECGKLSDGGYPDAPGLPDNPRRNGPGESRGEASAK